MCSIEEWSAKGGFHGNHGNPSGSATELDTGAQANILPYSVFHQLSPRPQLHPASTRLFAYGAEIPLAVEGQCICDVQFEGGRSRKLRTVKTASGNCIIVYDEIATGGTLLVFQKHPSFNSARMRFFVLSPTVTAEPLLGLQACDQLNCSGVTRARSCPE